MVGKRRGKIVGSIVGLKILCRSTKSKIVENYITNIMSSLHKYLVSFRSFVRLAKTSHHQFASTVYHVVYSPPTKTAPHISLYVTHKLNFPRQYRFHLGGEPHRIMYMNEFSISIFTISPHEKPREQAST